MTAQNWTIVTILKTTADFFSQKNIENPRLNAELLLGHVLDMPRVRLYLEHDRPLSPEEVKRYREQVRRRVRHEPLQYIVGSAGFMGMEFEVTPAVLIPRPETELLAEKVLELKETMDAPRLLDIGTGSGALAVSLARLWPQSRVTALDISAAALQVAQNNAQRLLAGEAERVTFYRHNVLADWPRDLRDTYDVIVSNPPYIRRDEMDGLQREVRDYEPANALTDGGDGLVFYRRLFDLTAKGILHTRHLFVEMSGSQPEKIRALCAGYNFPLIKIYPDLNNRDRILHIQF
ncbi:MAG: peptide chain release factor N(5)-glutamine methyltransferase [Calditrichaeota bacterium]|nr:MAG: peptide chain release factor N(5)-glutamine methyltransferase [Calditrichota bacterium]